MHDRRSCVIAVFALVALAATPPTSAQDVPPEVAERPTTDITFYGHVFGFGRAAPMPMNTEFPVGEADLSGGVTGDGCGVDATGTSTPPSCDNSPGDEVWLYTTAGFVDATSRFDFSYENTHNERGLTKDFVLDTTKPIKATFYMSADTHPWLFVISDPNGQGTPADPEDLPWAVPTWNWDPGTLPKWQIQATLYAAVLGEYGGQANTAP
ncbi:MAG TPA: hypothetical protein VI997_00005, partial [Candidatus Thermoplasmatota archaeon]|nr:hypothetical protein [Candidatus Thermoplasmatota archaeon]